MLWEALSIVAALHAPLNAQTRTIRPSDLRPSLGSALRRGDLRIVDSARSKPVALNTAAISLQKGQFLATRTGDSIHAVTRPIPLGMAGSNDSKTVDTLLVLPYSFDGFAKNNRPMHLQPVVVRDLVLRYQPEAGAFRGSFLVGLQDSDAPALRNDIGGAIPLTLVSNGQDADSIAPRSVLIGYTNYPLEHVTVIARNPRDSVSIRVVPQFDPLGTTVWLPVHPSLVFDAPQRASGFGIQTLSFPVRLVGASVRDSVSVTLAADLGSLETNGVKIGPSGSAMVHLRTAGTGLAHLSAYSPGIDGASTGIAFVWPFAFLIAAFLGGAVGGLAKRLKGRHAKTTHLVKPVLVGCLIGFVVAIAYYALNVSLLPFVIKSPLFDEVAVFALAMLGALFGIREPKTV
jgi:hypothetical protein